MTEISSQAHTRHAVEKLTAAPEKSNLRPPADAATVRLVNLSLNKAGYGSLPTDYAYLLTLTCGVQGPYCTLLSPGGMRTAEGAMEPGIHEASEDLNAFMDGAEKRLVLGRASGNVWLVYVQGEYRLLDAQSHDTLRTYDGVADFIEDMIALKERSRGAAR
jgi:hypothetical protein